LNKHPQRASISPYIIAEIYSALGDKDRAFTNLEIAYRERQWEMAYLAVDPDLENLHTDPRFADLLRRMNLPPRPQLAPRPPGRRRYNGSLRRMILSLFNDRSS
ncbi:MAG: TPR end-of-group domain-containing protein, partial [Terriglobia bacterium]